MIHTSSTMEAYASMVDDLIDKYTKNMRYGGGKIETK